MRINSQSLAKVVMGSLAITGDEALVFDLILIMACAPQARISMELDERMPPTDSPEQLFASFKHSSEVS